MAEIRGMDSWIIPDERDELQPCTTSVALSSVSLVIRNICFPYPVGNLRDVLIDPADGRLHLFSNYLVLYRAGVNFEAVTVETPRKRARHLIHDIPRFSNQKNKNQTFGRCCLGLAGRSV